MIDLVIALTGMAATYKVTEKKIATKIDHDRDVKRLLRHEPVAVPPMPSAPASTIGPR